METLQNAVEISDAIAKSKDFLIGILVEKVEEEGKRLCKKYPGSFVAWTQYSTDLAHGGQDQTVTTPAFLCPNPPTDEAELAAMWEASDRFCNAIARIDKLAMAETFGFNVTISISGEEIRIVHDLPF